MRILAIETSCDDTSVAIIKVSGKKKPSFKILSNIVSSQTEIHKQWGGVYPTLAKREHQKNLAPVLRKALKEGGLLKPKTKNQKPKTRIKNKKLREILKRETDLLKNLTKFLGNYQKPKIDAIAVTIGPGLEPCLWVGVNLAKALAYFWNLPVIPINHIEGHILANWLSPIGENYKPQTKNHKLIKFPAVCLLVSGGHTQLVLMRAIGKYKIIGETRDDAAGECFDKTARILGLGYPGGPAIATEAAKLQTTNYKLQTKLPRPMIYQKNYDFSFSGLKTAVLYDFKNRSLKTRRSKRYVRAMSAEIQQAIIDVLIKKTIKAAREYKAKFIILGGGVTANKELRRQLKLNLKSQNLNLNFLAPSKNFCTDNAAMIGIAGYFNRKKAKDWRKIKTDANKRI